MNFGNFTKRTRQMVAGCLVYLAFAAPARADALLEEAVSFNGAILHLQTDVPGLILGAVRGGEVAVAGFGETERGNGIAPDGETVLRLGSITKVFAGEMLAHAVTRGEVGFTDPVAPLLPGRLRQAAGGHPPIRLIDLVTHAGGLPREAPRKDSPPEDPFATITYDAFANWLEDNPLQFAPGTSIAYSNFGFDLLSAALSNVGGASYADLLAERITGQVGMDDTGFDVTPAMKGRLMSGHAPTGDALPDVPTGEVITGSGGLRSTANDLLKWMQWHLHSDPEGAEVRFLDHAVYVQRDGMETVLSMDESGRMDAMGLGWVAMNPTAEHPFILQKAGALQGQMSYIAFAPEHGTAVFVSINQFDFAAAYAMTDLANGLLADLSGY
ncbi:D-alanyl-D-alanine-carboxypeptidase/endopeptidase AmpH [uncultured Roseovarius sp.]|uniref:D-alanyl-D-alanine- carboxypeptidase/endopeptidase AmpH n=1 Tax=uncultured Roseovarius sp. TaxID=293344 RepID=UPI002595D89B|nr:D-alanyl-D-alanine-carboxypeptidase/endopeptidase AmpH [uncultured Roseovarius sp.]